MPVGDVQVLSESEDEAPLSPEAPVRQPRKRRRKADPLPPDQDPAVVLRALLGVKCKCKRRDCMSLFRGARFQALLDYRLSFNSMHKLDKDHAVPYQRKSNLLFLF